MISFPRLNIHNSWNMILVQFHSLNPPLLLFLSCIEMIHNFYIHGCVKNSKYIMLSFDLIIFLNFTSNLFDTTLYTLILLVVELLKYFCLWCVKLKLEKCLLCLTSSDIKRLVVCIKNVSFLSIAINQSDMLYMMCLCLLDSV